MAKELPRFANQYTNHPLGDKPTHCDVTDNKVLTEFAKDCDINYIVEQYSSGIIDKLPVVRKNVFGDETVIPKTYDEMKEFTNKLEDDFKTLPAKVKKEFGNNPQVYASEFMNVFTDENIAKKFDNLGIFKKPVELNPTSADPSLLTSGSDSNLDTKSLKSNDNNTLTNKESGQNGTN